MSSLQERLAELRRDKPEVTNAELARAAGVRPPSVSEWFTGDTKSLKAKSAQAIAAAYGVTVQWVTTGKGPKYALGWPFSAELASTISTLGKMDLWFAENALRNHLRMDTLPKPSGGSADTVGRESPNGTTG